MSEASPEKAEGWGVIRPGDRKAHYYRDTMSLCRRVGFYTGSLDTSEAKSPDDCTGCRKVLDREKAQTAEAGRGETHVIATVTELEGV